MKKACEHPKVGIGVLVEKNNKYLFGMRVGEHGKNTWSPPGGHLEQGETPQECAARETKEETGVEIKNVGFAYVTNDYLEESGKHCITVHLKAQWAGGEPRVAEKDKWKKWQWLTWDEIKLKGDKLFLPIRNLVASGYSPESKSAREYLDGWKRCRADFDNYKKRHLNDMEQFRQRAAESIVEELVPILDNFRHSIVHVPRAEKDNSWVEGILYILKQFKEVLNQHGVEEFGAVGDEFDPKYHEAVVDSYRKNVPKRGTLESPMENTISKVLQKGYRIGEKVIRPARVIVE